MSSSTVTPKKREVKNERGQNIQVFVRVRPLNNIEKSARSYSVVDTSSREVIIKEKASSSLTKTFNFDSVFGVNSKQQDVHKKVVGPLIDQVLQGYNCTVFAYGQTGTGKTYTMEGTGVDKNVWDNDPEAGIIPRSLSDIFDGLRLAKATDFAVRVSFLELYNEEIFDLLSGEHDTTKLRLYEDSNKKGSVIIQGLEEVQVHSKAEVYKILERGSIKRQTAATLMNANSSRSHTVFTVTVLINQTNMGEEEMIKIGKLNLVDLAGSENIGRSGAVEKRAREAGNINQSLLTLGRVITSLVDRTPHIPYRESKLTRLLQDSLGGRTKTSIIATVSPAGVNLEETLSTLDYAHRAKNITNKPEINQKISKRAKLLEYTEEIDRLKSELFAAREKDGVFLPHATYNDLIKNSDSQNQEITSLVEKIKVLEDESEKLEEMFKQTTSRLEETVKERDDTLKTLACTRSILSKTEVEKEEQQYLVSKHVETECKLSQQANRLLTVSDESTRELEKIHDKLDRKRLVESANEKTLSEFRMEFGEKYAQMEKLVQNHVNTQTQFFTEMRDSMGTSLDQRSFEKVQISEAMRQVMEQVVAVISDVENAVSENMYAEQAWVNSQMKLTRNSADNQQKSLQSFLTDKILPQLEVVVSSLADQNTVIHETSSKIDLLVATQNRKWEKFIKDQNELRSGVGKLMREIDETREKQVLKIVENEKLLQKSAGQLDKDFAEMMNMMKTFATKMEDHVTTTNTTTASTNELIAAVQQGGEELNAAVKSYSDMSIAKAESILFEQGQESEKIVAAKNDCVEAVEKTSRTVSSASDTVSAETKEFVTLDQDAWENHYSVVERDLREKSDKSADHLKYLQEKTRAVRTTMLDSQKSMESRLESQSADDLRITRDLQSNLEGTCKGVSTFAKAISDDLKQVDTNINHFITKRMRRDIPTGETPVRTQSRLYPRELVQGTPDSIRLERYRKQKKDLSSVSTSKLEGLEEDDDDDDDIDSVISANTMASEDLAESASSRKEISQGLSRQNSRDSNASSRNGSLNSLNNDYDDDSSDRENKSQNFVKPRTSKLKRPEVYSRASGDKNSESRSRSGSRTRHVLASVN